MSKNAVIGLKGIHFAPIATNTDAAYVTEEAIAIPKAGSMTRTPKENTGEFYYDDELYATVSEVLGEEVEIKLGELSLELMEQLGLGTLDSSKMVLEGDFAPEEKKFAVRFVTPTVDSSILWNYRLFTVTSVRYGDFTTKNSGAQVAEVSIKGVFRRPAMKNVKPYQIRQGEKVLSAEDMEFLSRVETLPKADA